MDGEKFARRIFSILVIWAVMLAILCLSEKSTKEDVPEKLQARQQTGQESDKADQAAGKEEAEKERGETKEERGAYVSGSGIKFAKSLSEEVAAALENGDTEFLVGIAFGEKFDYGVYSLSGKNAAYKKGSWHSDELLYFFDGEGHRFSGFSYSYTDWSEPFLEMEAHDPVFLLLEAFGEPDTYEVWETGSGGEKKGLQAEWYFEKAVLKVYEYDAEIKEIEYRALGDAADGDGTKTKSDFEKRMALGSEYERAEAVYSWDMDTSGTLEYKQDCGEESARQILQEQGFDVSAPESSFCDEEEGIYGACYADGQKERYCFVIYGDGFIDYTVKELKEAGEPEHLIYRCDETGAVVQETQYDAWGIRMAEASYKYYDGVPFPFLTGDWNTGYYGGGTMTYHLCRDQKTWFLDQDVWVNDKGRVKTVSETDFSDRKIKDYFWYFDTFKYRADGKLRVIQEEIPFQYASGEEEIRLDILERPYFGEMKFQYDRSGTLKKIDYYHTDWDYGTWDQSGYIDFDRQGRMVHNHYYVTHGYHSKFYFYYGEEKRPRAVASWCWGYGFEEISVYQPLDEIYTDRRISTP